MATRDTGQPASGITRRDFLKTAAAATAVAGCGLEFAYDPAKAAAYENDATNYKVTFTTCPYCSASCGQRVVTALTGVNAGRVVDLYGDFQSPLNSGGLCAKGAGGLQLVNNSRRIGAWPANDPVLAASAGTHPVSSKFLATANTDPNYKNVAYKRYGNEGWEQINLDTALTEIATTLVAKRGPLDVAKYNQKNVAFFGCSHMNNESNYLYRKLIADFGSSNVEHQARI